MKCGVAPELRHGQPSAQAAWCLHALVDALTLAVCLQVVRGGVEQFGARSGEQLALEAAGEDLVAVGDDGGGDAVELDVVVQERACHLCHLKWVANLVKRSTTTMIVPKPSETGNPSTKSPRMELLGLAGVPGIPTAWSVRAWPTGRSSTAAGTPRHPA